jgi:hypothetical protein
MKQSQSQSHSLTIVIVDKTGTLKSLNVKEYKEEDLFKKCGFKKADGFEKHTVWPLKIDGQKYNVAMYGKLDGKANMENKYDFPPPIDTKLFFGACALVATSNTVSSKEQQLHNLSVELWEKMYEKLFGGFENLSLTVAEDEEEEDELAAIPASKKTKKGGYLKDGFVVDTDSSSDHSASGSEDEDDTEDSEDVENDTSDTDQDAVLLLEEIGSELSEESYDYSSEEDESDKNKKSK